MLTEDDLRKIAVPLCRLTHGDCVMDEDDRAPCTVANCRMMRAARLAVREAIATGPLPVAK